VALTDAAEPAGRTAPGPLLGVDGVSKSFGGLSALDQVSFAVAPGEVVCLIGPNGSGKTTLFNIVAGLLKPDAGTIAFAGEGIAGLPPHAIAARGVARTFQHARLFGDLTILDNLLVPQFVHSCTGLLDALLCRPRAHREQRRMRERAETLLQELAGGRLFHRRFDYPDSCSLGEQRMIEIMRALALEPRLLLMDEPTQGLNPVWVAEVLALIAEVRRRGMTILLIEHKVSLVMRISDRIVVLNAGRKISEGPPDFVRADPEVLRAYLGQ
jgi:ABC-type branched-subunit amino acid transport system ATPase component